MLMTLKMTEKLSIITINYNNLEGLKSTVESVINQSCQEFESFLLMAVPIDSN